MSYLLVNTLGISLILLSLWWFLLSKPPALHVTSANRVIDILVKEGIYQPSQIQIPARTAVTLRFFRVDPTPCAETVVFARLNRNYALPLNKRVDIRLDPQSPGELEFTCQMGMYRGRVVVE